MISLYYMKIKGYYAVSDFYTGVDESAVKSSTPSRLPVKNAFLRSGLLPGKMPLGFLK